MASNVFLVSSVFAVLFLDRLSKVLVIQNFHEGEGLTLLPGFLHLTRVNNTGAAFGLFRHVPAVLVAIAIIFIAGILAAFLTRRSRKAAWPEYGWAFVMAGAAGNLYDRLRHGYVIDFIDFRVWPVFNVADVSICAGVLLIFWGLLRPSARSRVS